MGGADIGKNRGAQEDQSQGRPMVLCGSAGRMLLGSALWKLWSVVVQARQIFPNKMKCDCNEPFVCLQFVRSCLYFILHITVFWNIIVHRKQAGTMNASLAKKIDGSMSFIVPRIVIIGNWCMHMPYQNMGLLQRSQK